MAVIRFVTVFLMGFVLLAIALMIAATRAFRRQGAGGADKRTKADSAKRKAAQARFAVRPKRVWQAN
jgi:hypothetical protein